MNHRIVALILMAGLLPFAALPAAESQPAQEALLEARELYVEEGPQAALPIFESALGLFRQASDARGEAITLGLIGNCYKRFGDYPRALELLSQALAMKRELGERLEEGKTLSHLGLVYWEQADYPEAIRHLRQAVAVGAELRHARLQGSALNNLSLVYDELGDYEKSLDQYQRVLELYRRTDFPRGESDTLGNIGGVHLLLGRYREARDYYQKALAISERLEAKPSISQDLGNLALCDLALGEIDAALAKLDRALALARETGLKKEEADWLKGKGAVLLETGRHSEGMELVRQALAIYEGAGLRRELVEALGELGNLHLLLGDAAAAEENLQSALELSRSLGHTQGVLSSLVSLGALEWHRHRFEAAATLYREALAGATAADDRNLMAACRIQLAFTYRDQGRLQLAMEEATQGLDLALSEGAKLQSAAALFAAGDIERLLGNPTAALEHFDAGLKLVEPLGEPEIAWRLAHGRGRALEALGRLDEAVGSYQRAVERIEAVRGRLREERFRAGYIENKYQVYVELARLLLRMEKKEEAFFYSEKLRARSHLDLLSRDRRVRPTDTERQREIELRQRIRSLEQALEDEEAQPTVDQRRSATAFFSAQLLEAEGEYERFLAGLRDADPTLAATWSLAVPAAATIQEVLPEDSALLEFVAGENELLVFVLSRTTIEARVVPLSKRDLTAKIELLRELVGRRSTADWRHPAASLAALLLAPLEREGWLEGVRHLYLVPHGALHYLPFAVLPRGPDERLLIEDYEITYLPAAGTLVGPTGQRRPEDSLFALAPRNPSLQYAAVEARSVARLYPERHLLLLGADATEGSFKELAGRYKLLHLATHNNWNRRNPLLSGLELEAGPDEDGRLEVHEILDLHLSADLVTLSACETALGSSYFGEIPVGDDFVGLTRAFLHAGSQAVMASLWEVDDRSTLELMRYFYSRLDARGPSAALASAQRSMLERADLAHPHHWSAFVIVGASARERS